jgi:hypothetical protein
MRAPACNRAKAIRHVERLLSGRIAVDEAILRFFVFIRVYTTTKPHRRKIYDLF